MDAVYIQKHEVTTITMTSEEIDEAYIKDLEARGYKVIPPEGK